MELKGLGFTDFRGFIYLLFISTRYIHLANGYYLKVFRGFYGIEGDLKGC